MVEKRNRTRLFWVVVLLGDACLVAGAIVWACVRLAGCGGTQ